jgi:hypothetical protein
MEETQCQYTHCRNIVQQQPGNHRRRLYCSDSCKQSAFRERVTQREKEAREAAIRERWDGFQPDTQQLLERVMQVCSEVLHGAEESLMQRLAEAIKAEQAQPAQTLASAYPPDGEELRQRWATGYLNITRSILDTILRENGPTVARLALVGIDEERRQAIAATQQHILGLTKREELEQQFLALASLIGYHWIIVNDRTTIQSGEEAYLSFMRDSDTLRLVDAVTRLKYYQDSIEYVNSRSELRKAQQRIKELEKEVEQHQQLRAAS